MNDKLSALRETLQENRKSRNNQAKRIFNKYGLMLIGILILCFLTLKDPMAIEDFTINDIQSTQTNLSNGWFVAGKANEGHRFAASKTNYNVETGVCEITLREYRFFGFIGGNDFVVYIKGNPEDIKEIWYVFPKEYVDSKEVKTLIMKDGVAYYPQ